jgi:hypothetical protein
MTADAGSENGSFDIPVSSIHQRVEAPIVCVLTRFGLRNARQLVPTYLAYRRVLLDARRAGTPGLLKAAFLVESATACYSLSLWANPGAIGRFGTDVQAHLDAANGIFDRLACDEEHGPQLWSTKWRLVSASNNLSWGDFDLRAAIAEAERADRLTVPHR